MAFRTRRQRTGKWRTPGRHARPGAPLRWRCRRRSVMLRIERVLLVALGAPIDDDVARLGDMMHERCGLIATRPIESAAREPKIQVR